MHFSEFDKEILLIVRFVGFLLFANLFVPD